MVIHLLFDTKEDACFLGFTALVQIYSNSGRLFNFQAGNRIKISIKICFVA